MLIPQSSTPNSLVMALLQGILLAIVGMVFFGMLLSAAGVHEELTHGPAYTQQTDQNGGWK